MLVLDLFILIVIPIKTYLPFRNDNSVLKPVEFTIKLGY